MARKVNVKICAEVILIMDEGVDVSKFLDEAELRLKSDDSRVDVIDIQLTNHEVTDSR